MRKMIKKLWFKFTEANTDKNDKNNISIFPDKTVENKTTFFIVIAILVWVVLFTAIVFILDEHAQLSGATDNNVRVILIESLAGILGAIVIIVVGYKFKPRKNKK